METYNGSSLVTSIGTDGAFKTGYYNGTGYITLDNGGLKIRSVADLERYAQSTIQFYDSSNTKKWGEISEHAYKTIKEDLSIVNTPVLQMASENGTRLYLSAYSNSVGAESNYAEICISPNTMPWIQWNGFNGSPDKPFWPIQTEIDLAGVIMSFLTGAETAHLGGGYKYIQCGLKEGEVGAVTTHVTFPKSFPNGVGFAIVCTIRDTSSGNGNDYVSNITKSGMDCKHESSSVGFYWLAIGY